MWKGLRSAVTWGFINSEGHYVNTNINNKCVARQNCTWFVGGDEFQELPSLLQETVFQSAVTVYVEFETLHTHEHKNDMSAHGEIIFFSSFTVSVLFRFSSHLPLQYLHTHMQEDFIVQRLLFHSSRELMGKSHKKNNTLVSIHYKIKRKK